MSENMPQYETELRLTINHKTSQMWWDFQWPLYCKLTAESACEKNSRWTFCKISCKKVGYCLTLCACASKPSSTKVH